MTKDRDGQKTVCLDQVVPRCARHVRPKVFRAFMSAPVEAEAITSSSIPLPPRRRAKSGDRVAAEWTHVKA